MTNIYNGLIWAVLGLNHTVTHSCAVIAPDHEKRAFFKRHRWTKIYCGYSVAGSFIENKGALAVHVTAARVEQADRSPNIAIFKLSQR